MKEVYKIGHSDDLNSSQAVLLIEIGDAHCCFGIMDYANFMMVQFGYYSSENRYVGDMLKEVIERHPELQQSFRQTVVGYYTAENVLIPSKFYRYEETQKLLPSMYERDHNVVVSESVAEWQLYNVYYVPSATHGLLSRMFATGKFWHMYSVWLKKGLREAESGTLLVDFKTESFSVIAVKKHALLMAQIFPYSKAADVLYWLLRISSEFSLLPTDVKVILSGLVDRQSSVFRRLYQYFVDVEFTEAENGLRLSGDFNDYPVHFFSSMYKLASCVS